MKLDTIGILKPKWNQYIFSIHQANEEIHSIVNLLNP
jgi:hypothetical protein